MNYLIDGHWRDDAWVETEQGIILWWTLYSCANRYVLWNRSLDYKITFAVDLITYLYNEDYLDEVFFGKWKEAITEAATKYYTEEE